VAPRYTSHPEGGGTWIHGTDGPNNTAYSKFFHATRKHGSSVGNGQGFVNRTGTIAANKWANSSIRKTWAGNIAYYRFIK
jgi:lactococcin 972 family bacteriocin